jgi:hypothetical protein
MPSATSPGPLLGIFSSDDVCVQDIEIMDGICIGGFCSRVAKIKAFMGPRYASVDATYAVSPGFPRIVIGS